jgi:hypothetical protein
MKEEYKVEFSCVLYNYPLNNNLDINNCSIQIVKVPESYKNLDDFKMKYKSGNFTLMSPNVMDLYCVYQYDNDFYYTIIKQDFKITCDNNKYEIEQNCLKNTKVYKTIELLRLITNEHIFIYNTTVKVKNKDNVLIHDGIVSDYVFPSLAFVNSYRQVSKEKLESRLSTIINYSTYLEIIANDNFLKTAYDFYDDSFFQHNINTKFLLLFSALETFFNTGPNDITFKLSLYTSILIVGDDKLRKKIQKRISDLYAKRSNVAHGKDKGKKDKSIKAITEDDEFELREYVRLVILRYIEWSIKTKNNSQDLFIEYINGIIFSGNNPVSYKDYF